MTFLTCEIALFQGQTPTCIFLQALADLNLSGLSPSGKGLVEIEIYLEKRSVGVGALT